MEWTSQIVRRFPLEVLFGAVLGVWLAAVTTAMFGRPVLSFVLSLLAIPYTLGVSFAARKFFKGSQQAE